MLYGLTCVFLLYIWASELVFGVRVQRCNRYVELLHLICWSFLYLFTEIRHASSGTSSLPPCRYNRHMVMPARRFQYTCIHVYYSPVILNGKQSVTSRSTSRRTIRLIKRVKKKQIKRTTWLTQLTTE